MKRFLTLIVAIAAATGALSAQAAFLDVQFSGAVVSGNAFATGSTLSGDFEFDTVSGNLLSFNIQGFTVTPGFASTAALSPDHYSALYSAQLSPVATLGTVNSTFTLDLEGLNPWSALSAAALLSDSSQLASNLDSTASNFGFYIASADGTNIQQASASIASLNVATVPVPPSGLLILIGALGFGLRKRSR